MSDGFGEDWQSLKQWAQRALELEPEDRGEFIERAVPSELRSRVRDLARADEGAERFLQEAVVPSDAPVPAPFAVPDGFSILELAGAGGVGAVYRAQQHQPQRVVALKVLRSGLPTNDAVARLRFESEVLAGLEHEGIAQVYASGMIERDGQAQPWFAMEWIDGLALTAGLDQRGATTIERVRVIVSVAKAIHHAHLRGIVHRDLKPANILLDQSGRAKVLDFGIALALEEDAALEHTQTGLLLGTLPYMSPEQLSGRREDIDVRTDVYSLGVLAFEVLAGSHPLGLESHSVTEALRVIREVRPVRLRAATPGASKDLETILAKAMAKSRGERYASAAGFAADLTCWLTHRPITARPPNFFYRTGKTLRRHRLAFSALAAVLIALASGLAVALAAKAEADRSRDGAQRAERSADRARRRAEDRLTDSQTLVRFFADLIGLAAPASAGHRELTVIEAVDAIAPTLDSRLGLRERPRALAGAQLAVGALYRRLNRRNEARLHIECAVRQFAAQGADDDVLFADARVQLASFLFFDDAPRALSLMRAAQAAYLERGDFERAHALSLTIIEMQIAIGSYAEAEASLAQWKRDGAGAPNSWAIYLRAALAFQREDYAAAEADLQRLRKEWASLPLDDSRWPRLHLLASQLASVSGRWPAALEQATLGVQRSVAIYGSAHDEVYRNLVRLADCELATGAHQQALQTIQRARGVLDSLGHDSKTARSDLAQLEGLAQWNLGQLEAALPHLEDSLRLSQEARPAGALETTRKALELATLCLRTGRNERARTVFSLSTPPLLAQPERFRDLFWARMADYARVLENLEAYEEAIRTIDASLAAIAEPNTTEQLTVAWAKDIKVRCLNARERFREALPIAQEVAQVYAEQGMVVAVRQAQLKNLAEIERRVGSAAGELVALRSLLAILAPDDESRAATEQRLKELEAR